MKPFWPSGVQRDVTMKFLSTTALFTALALAPALHAAATLDLANASEVRFGAKFTRESGKPVAHFSGGGYLHPKNGFSVPVLIRDAGDLAVSVTVRAPKGQAASVEFQLNGRTLTKDFTGTGEFQVVELSSIEGARPGTVYPVINAPKGKSVVCSGLTLSGKAGDTAAAVPFVPMRVVYATGGAERRDRAVVLGAPGATVKLPLIFTRSGKLGLTLRAKLEKDVVAKLRVNAGKTERTVELKGSGDFTEFPLGDFEIPEAGTKLVTFAAESGAPASLAGVTLAGYAVNEASPLAVGNAQSVHFGYAVPKGHTAKWVYLESRSEPGPPQTYNMAIGFNAGYFGYQRKQPGDTPGARCYIFSVWDNGYVKNKDKGGVNSATADKAVAMHLVKAGEGVIASAFDHEGSGGHSHRDHNWHDGKTQKFLLGVRQEGTGAIFDAFVKADDEGDWKLIASFYRPRTKAELTGLYSFVEDWGGAWGDQKRTCHYGNIWIRDTKDAWVPVAEATGSRTEDAGREDFSHYLDKDGSVVLTTGGFGPDTNTEDKPIAIPTPANPPAIDFTKLPIPAAK